MLCENLVFYFQNIDIDDGGREEFCEEGWASLPLQGTNLPIM